MVSIKAIFISFVVTTVVVNAGVTDFKKLIFTDPDADEFAAIMDANNYNAKNIPDVIKRLGYFKKAKKMVQELQAKSKGSAVFGMNKFSLMSDEERQKFLGALPAPRGEIREKRNAVNGIFGETAAPASFDFRDYGKVSPVKNQGGCGSCWAFASAAATESQYLLRRNLSLDLSEQHLLNCEGGTCGGGYTYYTLGYIRDSGVTTEACMPYTQNQANCTTNCDNQRYKIDGFQHIGRNESTYALSIYNHGPATIFMWVPDEFYYYSSGVMDIPYAECYAKRTGAHAVIIVGWTADYWIAKNSWGTSWGEQGFFRFKRNQNWCGVTEEVLIPYLNATTPTPGNTTTTTTTTPAPTTAPSPFAGCPAGNGITSFNDANRQYVLDLFNRRRSEVAKGTFVMYNGQIAPPASDLVKFKYNCNLEKMAFGYCTNQSSQYEGNWSMQGTWFAEGPSINYTIEWAASKYVHFSAVQQGSNVMLQQGVYDGMWNQQNEIGCAYITTPITGIECAFAPKSTTNYYIPMYTAGPGCTSNSQCTTGIYNKCDTSLKLCYS